MRQKQGKVVSVILAACVLVGLFAGCKQNKPAGDSSAGSGPKTTLKVEVFDRGKAGQPDLNNNYWTRWINTNFGAKNNCTVEFVSVPRSQEIDKLNVLMASNSAPDISFTYDAGTVINYVTQGGLTQLDTLISKYGQTLSKYLGKDVLSYGKFSGKQFAIPGKRTIVMTLGTFIRKDWLDKLNLPLPKTRQEFYDDLVAFRDKNPGGVSGVIPYVVGGFGSSNNVGTANLCDSFYPKLSEQEIAATTLSTKDSLNWKRTGYKDYMQFMNKLYHEKLISQDFAIDKTDSLANAAMSSGKAGVISANWDYVYRSSPGIYSTLKKNIPTAELVPVDCFQNSQGKYSKAVYTPNAAYLIIPKSSKNAEMAIKYLNWMADSKVTLDLQNGEAGVDYNLVSGIPTPVTPTTYVGDKLMGTSFNGDYDMLTNGPELGDNTKNMQLLALGYPGFEKDIPTAAKIGMTDTYVNYNFTTPNSAYAKYSATLSTLTTQMIAALITCDSNQFSSQYDSLLANYMSSGGQAVYDENIKNYNAQKNGGSSSSK